MIEVLEKTNLIDLFMSNKLDGIVHQTNTRKVMGAGLARSIASSFPEALIALQNSNGVLGEVSRAQTDHGIIYNLTAQNLNGVGRKTNYEAFYIGMKDVEFFSFQKKQKFKLGIPGGIGCGLGGGDWQIISAMLNSIFEKSDVNAIICKID